MIVNIISYQEEVLQMTRIMIAPGKYVQGFGELKRLKSHIGALGKSFLVLISGGGLARLGETLAESFEGDAGALVFEKFNGECSKKEIERIRAVCRDKKCDAVLGVGGGKILDTAKAVAFYEKKPVVVVPTIASTDAPCSALSVIYTEQGVFSEYLLLPKNPDVVLVDTEVISKAPVRLLAAGMGDALATYFEARACIAADKTAMAGGHATKAALALAKLCYDTLLADGVKALLAVEASACTKAVENIVEANTYLSGLGFESGGLGAAHAIHNGFTVMEECHELYHGEKVAFGTLVQLVLENAPEKELEEVLGFCASVGLPVTLEEMGVTDVNPERIMEVAKTACAPGETIHNMPFAVTPQDVSAAILAANALGRSFLA